MADFVILEKPEFNGAMRKLETTDKAHADLFNGMFGQLLENEAYLKGNGGIAVMEEDIPLEERREGCFYLKVIGTEAEEGGEESAETSSQREGGVE